MLKNHPLKLKVECMWVIYLYWHHNQQLTRIYQTQFVRKQTEYYCSHPRRCLELIVLRRYKPFSGEKDTY